MPNNPKSSNAGRKPVKSSTVIPGAGSASFGSLPPEGTDPQTGGGFARSLTKRFTGRLLVVMDRGEVKARLKNLKDAAGLTIANSTEFKTKRPAISKMKQGEGIYFEHLGIALVNQDEDQHRALTKAQSQTEVPVRTVEPERYVYMFSGGSTLEYVRGYQEGVTGLAGRLLDGGFEEAPRPGRVSSADFQDGTATWGLDATGVLASTRSGAGIRVAVLDTGLDMEHPDFAGRTIFTESFTGEEFGDAQGHGTHCIGTALGTRTPQSGRRYGIAYNAEIFAGKVLNNEGFGDDGGILEGIEWAITNNCQIVSMSLGAAAEPGDPFSIAYETAARRAHVNGCTIIAARETKVDAQARLDL